MEFSTLIKNRYSVRSYKDQPVEKEKLIKVLEAGRLAPSAVNFQPWQFVVVTDPERMKAVQEAYSRDWIKEVQNCIIVCGNHDEGWKRRCDGKDHTDIDVAITVDHMTLQATELGLGTCWVCNFDPLKLSEILNLPSNLEPIVMIPIGYPTLDEIPEKKRKALEEIVSWEKYGER